jgi:hypothetical protein
VRPTDSVAGPPTRQSSRSWHSPRSATSPSASLSTRTQRQAPGPPCASSCYCGVCPCSAPRHLLCTPGSTTSNTPQVRVVHWMFVTMTTKVIKICPETAISGYVFIIYEDISKSFRTGRLERELQMIQLSATRCSCIAIL